MAEHHLKTWPEFYFAIGAGEKTWEFRKDDRGFRVGDVLVLEHWNPGRGRMGGYEYTARGSPWIQTQRVRVTYILHGGRCGIPEHFCVMSIVREEPPRHD